MPRLARENQISNYYHVMVQGDEKKHIFKKGVSKLRYLRFLMHNAARNNIHVLAYCIMNNHAHILVHVPNYTALSKMMLQLGTTYGIYYSKVRRNVGHVFRDRFKSEAISTLSYLKNCIKYIHENPVKAHIVDKPNAYRYSSYNEYVHKIGCYNQIFSLNVFSNETLSTIVQPSSLDFNFLDERPTFELLQDVFSEIAPTYDMTDLNKKQILEIYDILSKRCNAPRNEIAKHLNISDYHLKKLVRERQNQ